MARQHLPLNEFCSRRYYFDVGTVRPNLRALLTVPSNRQHVLTRHHCSRNVELVGNQRVVWITPTAKEDKDETQKLIDAGELYDYEFPDEDFHKPWRPEKISIPCQFPKSKKSQSGEYFGKPKKRWREPRKDTQRWYNIDVGIGFEYHFQRLSQFQQSILLEMIQSAFNHPDGKRFSLGALRDFKRMVVFFCANSTFMKQLESSSKKEQLALFYVSATKSYATDRMIVGAVHKKPLM